MNTHFFLRQAVHSFLIVTVPLAEARATQAAVHSALIGPYIDYMNDFLSSKTITVGFTEEHLTDHERFTCDYLIENLGK